MKRSATLAILAAAFAVMISSGIRSSFGLFQLPIVAEVTNDQRELFSLAIAINRLIYGLPLAGILATRFGSRNILIGDATTHFSMPPPENRPRNSKFLQAKPRASLHH